MSISNHPPQDDGVHPDLEAYGDPFADPKEIANWNRLQQEEEKHRFDGVDPLEEIERVILCRDEAITYLDDAINALLQVDGFAGQAGWKEMSDAVNSLRGKVTTALDAMKAIQPNAWLESNLEECRQRRAGDEDASDALSY